MPPSHDLYLEDVRPGLRFETGRVTVGADEIIDFARRYDPQYFHVDPEAAKASAFGGLVASGLHTLNLVMRLFFDLHLWPRAIIGSPGMNEVRWLKPVRPGDTLTGSVEVTDVRRSVSKPDRGIVTTRHQAVNQHGETVFTAVCLHMLHARGK